MFGIDLCLPVPSLLVCFPSTCCLYFNVAMNVRIFTGAPVTTVFCQITTIFDHTGKSVHIRIFKTLFTSGRQGFPETVTEV